MEKTISVKITAIDLIVYTILLFFFGFFLLSFDYSTGNGLTVVTFYINGLFFLYKVIKPQKCVTIKRNIYIFNLVFFFFAPLQQYLERTVLWRGNGMSLSFYDNDYIKTNGIILASCVLFELSYFYTASKDSKKTSKVMGRLKDELDSKKSMRTMKSGVVISVFCTIILWATNGMGNLKNISSLTLQLRHMLLFAPVLYLLISMTNAKQGVQGAKKYCVFFLINAIVIILAFSNIMARFLMLGAVMTIISFKFSNYRHKSLYVLVYTVGFFFAFSMMRYIDLLEADFLHVVDFNQNDYDAYQMFMSIIRYVEDEGISWGMNFVSALFCLVPRSLASWRFEPTGGIVIEYYGSWFTNVSSPLVSEMYFAFGLIGVVVLSLALGVMVKKIDLMDLCNSNFKQGIFALISGLSIYLLRGAFLAAFSYTLGLLIAYCVIYSTSFLKIK